MPRFASAVQTLTVRGGTTAGSDLQLSSTSHATKGKILLGAGSAFDEATGRLGIGTTAPTKALDVVGSAGVSDQFTLGAGWTLRSITAGRAQFLGEFWGERAAEWDGVFLSQVTGDANGRWMSLANGYQMWGNGTAAFDVFLGRDSAGVLKTDGSHLVTGNLTVNGIGQTLFRQKSVVQTRNTTTLINVTDMVVPVVANAKYVIQLRATYDAPTATDIKMAWTIPSGYMQRNILAPSTNTTGYETTQVQMIRRGEGTAQWGGGSGGNPTAFGCWWEEILLQTGATAGNVQLQFAPQGSGTATFQPDSYLICTRVA